MSFHISYKMLFSKLMQSASGSSFRRFSVKLKNTKGKGVSSHEWLSRQLSDPYVEKAKMLNYRCRSAFKLLEIDERFRILSPGAVVVDCGAAPGSWTQVVVEKINSKGTDKSRPTGVVVAIDKQQIYPIEGALILGNADFTLPESQQKIKTLLDGRHVDTVLSDMAPKATGVRELDNENIVKLCYSTLRFAVQVSEVGASLVVKLWQCGDSKQLEDDMRIFYNNVKVVKPNSSRSDSAEIFLLAREFKGLKK